jgi:hypothetical protein
VGGYFHLNNVPWLEGEEGLNVGFGAAARWYPAARRFFIELGLGFNSLTHYYERVDYSGYYPRYYASVRNTSSFSIVPGFGWTIDIGSVGGIFLSTGLKIPITFGTDNDFLDDLLNGAISQIVYFGVGYAF